MKKERKPYCKQIRILPSEKFKDSLLSDEEWQKLSTFISQCPKPFTPDTVLAIRRKCEKLYTIHCTGENLNKCINCGREGQKKSGLCLTCYRRATASTGPYLRGESLSRKDAPCISCGKKGMSTNGLCRSCYLKKMKYNISESKNVAEVLNEIKEDSLVEYRPKVKMFTK